MTIQTSQLNPKLIFIQASTPSDVTEGKLWYNTSNKKTYVSDGTNYNLVADVDLTSLIQTNLENSLDILELQIAETLESGQGANLIRDVFSDSTGYLNTIDTGNTTATFTTNLYKNIIPSGTQLDSTTLTGSSTESSATRAGLSFTLNRACMLVSATKNANCTADRCYLYEATDLDSGTLLATQTYTANVATFNYPLNPEKTYFVLAGLNSGGAYTRTYGVNTYPKSNADININGAVTLDSGGLQSDIYINILSLKTDAYSIGDTIIQTNMQTLNSTPTKAQIFAWKDATTGTGSINASVSFDNGAHYQTMALNTETTITDTGNKMILKINLNAGESDGTSECKGYGVLFW